MSLILPERLKRKAFVTRLYDDAFAARCTVPELFERRRRVRRSWDQNSYAFVTTEDKIKYGTYTAMTVTNLQSLANDSTDPFACWQSDRVDNQTNALADDYEIRIKLTTANTAPANDQAAYVYLVPWIYNGSSFDPGANFGTTTEPTGSEGTASISDPNSMKGPIAIPYKIAQQLLEVWFTVGQLCCGVVPDGWSLVIRNCTGAALSTSCVVAYRPITYTNS